MTIPAFTDDDLRALLEREEGQFLEFKSVWDRDTTLHKLLHRRDVRDTIAEYVAAFANADGGVLLVGVENDGSVSGHKYPDQAVQDFFAVPSRRLRPPVSCRCERLSVDGREVLAFEVSNASEAVMVDGNGYPYRVGDQVVREPQEIINQRKESYRRVGYEQRIQSEATLDDLDMELATSFLGRTPFSARTVEQILERYGLIQASRSGWRITNAALLLFAKESLARWHPRAGARLFRVAGTERRHGAKRNVTQLARVDLPMAKAIFEVHRVAREHIRRSEKLHDLLFKRSSRVSGVRVAGVDGECLRPPRLRGARARGRDLVLRRSNGGAEPRRARPTGHSRRVAKSAPRPRQSKSSHGPRTGRCGNHAR